MSKAPLQHWEYRAYTSDRRIVEGQEQANNFQHLALTLRQKGLQVLDATLVSPDQNVAEDRLTKMKSRLQPQEELETPKWPRWSIRGWISSAISLFRRG